MGCILEGDTMKLKTLSYSLNLDIVVTKEQQDALYEQITPSSVGMMHL